MRSVESIKGIPSGEYNEILLSPQKEIIRKYDLTNEWADYKYMHAMSNITNYYNGSNAYHAIIPNSRSNHGYELAL